MYRNEDLERFYFKYQSEALPHGQSLQSFCLNNNVPYNLFSKWYKDTRRKIVAVQVDDRPFVLCINFNKLVMIDIKLMLILPR